MWFICLFIYCIMTILGGVGGVSSVVQRKKRWDLHRSGHPEMAQASPKPVFSSCYKQDTCFLYMPRQGHHKQQREYTERKKWPLKNIRQALKSKSKGEVDYERKNQKYVCVCEGGLTQIDWFHDMNQKLPLHNSYTTVKEIRFCCCG